MRIKNTGSLLAVGRLNICCYTGVMRSKRSSRRELLRLGFAGGIGLSLYDMLRLDACGALDAAPKADAIIYLFLQGGIEPTVFSFPGRRDNHYTIGACCNFSYLELIFLSYCS